MTTTSIESPVPVRGSSLSICTRVCNLILLIFLVAAILHSVFINFRYISKPVIEWYSFRQTQTAITAEYLQKNGFSFRYETPVVGEPWSIPFEFPIYQQLVAWTSTVLHTPLTDTGRAVCFLFFGLSGIMLWRIMSRIGLSMQEKMLTQIFYWVLPANVFWAGTFMIEYAALFFSLGFLYFALHLLKRDAKWFDFAGAFAFLTLGLLQKITTVLPVLAVVVLVVWPLLFFFRKDDVELSKKRILLVFLVIGIAFAVGYKWVSFTDQVKSQNLVGSYLTSEKLKWWNYGSLTQRFDGELWTTTIFERCIKPLGGLIIVTASAFSLVFFTDQRRRVTAGLALLLFLVPFFVFTNLHIRHDYYQAANNCYVCLFLAICLYGAWDNSKSSFRQIFCVLAIGAFASWSLYTFYHSIFHRQKTVRSDVTTEKMLMITEFVKQHTQQDSIVVWYGCDWNSLGAFYSKRRSLTVPDYGDLEVQAINNLGEFISKPPSAIVVCPFGRREIVEGILKTKYPYMKSHQIFDSTIYYTEASELKD